MPCKFAPGVSLIWYIADMGRESLIGPATEYIARELRAQQARYQWTLNEIAERSGIPRSTVDRALKGRSALAVEVLIPLCAAMDLDLTRLLTEAARARN